MGCGVCWNTGTCCLKDDFQTVLDNIIGADGVIFSTPVYVNNMTAQLKTLLDRMTSPLHCQVFDGKYTAVIATTGSGDDDTVIAMLNEFAIQCGAAILNGVGMAWLNPGAFDRAQEQSKVLGKELALAIKEHKSFPEQQVMLEKSRKRFAITVNSQKDRWKHDYQYWVNRGWLKP